MKLAILICVLAIVIADNGCISTCDCCLGRECF